MTAWRDVEKAAPDLARRVRALFDSHRHKTIATLRADGSPRISGIECAFEDGELVFGSMAHARKGADLRRTGTTLTAEGAIGYVGYFAGPSVHIVDYHALADPLLARLPMVASDPFYAAFLRRVRPGEVAAPWRVGHFMRALPAGYMSSLASGENRIADPAVRALWDRVARVTRGPVWSAARLRDVVDDDYANPRSTGHGWPSSGRVTDFGIGS